MKYQQAIYAMDWTFATLYAIHLTPGDGGYRAEREELISGAGLPPTDLTICKDGAMYFLTGGENSAAAGGNRQRPRSGPQAAPSRRHQPLAGRFTVRDLAESILEPSKVISNQFAFDLITRQDGTQVTGKIIEEKDEKWVVATNPFDLTQTTEIENNDIKENKHSPVSPMPPALINRLNPDELKDLLAYLLGK